MTRPGVAVILPFLGDEAEARSATSQLSAIDAADRDDLIVADNTPTGLASAIATDPVRVVDASDRRSASHARNAGAAATGCEWLLFVDADCVLPPDILERYFAEPLGERCGVVAGEIVGDPNQSSFPARWARSRRGLWVQHHLDSGPHPGGITANLLVRRQTWTDLGGFKIGGGGDLDLSWRAQDAGWDFEYRPDIVVTHKDRETLREVIQQAFSYGSHGRHLQALHGPAVERARLLRPVARGIGGMIAWTLRRQFTRAGFSAIDVVWAAFYWLGDLTAGRGARRND